MLLKVLIKLNHYYVLVTKFEDAQGMIGKKIVYTVLIPKFSLNYINNPTYRNIVHIDHFHQIPNEHALSKLFKYDYLSHHYYGDIKNNEDLIDFSTRVIGESFSEQLAYPAMRSNSLILDDHVLLGDPIYDVNELDKYVQNLLEIEDVHVINLRY